MRSIEELQPSVIRDLDAAHIVHGEIMDEMVRVQGILEGNLDNHIRLYYNSKLDTLMDVYGLLNDIMWEKEKAAR
jgi:hypothetical protein